MADKITIELQGFKELADLLKDFGPRVAKNGLRSSTFAGAKVVKGAIQQKAPVDTGLLRESVSTFRRRTPDNVAQYSVGLRVLKNPKYVLVARHANTAKNSAKGRVGKTHSIAGPALYGRFLEYGTSKMSARPFMRPAIAEATTQALDAIKGGLEKAVDRAAKKANG